VHKDNLFERLEDGVLLCDLAAKVTAGETKWGSSDGGVDGKPFPKAPKGQDARLGGKKQIAIARDNCHKFIKWCKGAGLPESVVFESEDLVSVSTNKTAASKVLICLWFLREKERKYVAAAEAEHARLEAEEKARRNAAEKETVAVAAQAEQERLLLEAEAAAEQAERLRIRETKTAAEEAERKRAEHEKADAETRAAAAKGARKKAEAEKALAEEAEHARIAAEKAERERYEAGAAAKAAEEERQKQVQATLKVEAEAEAARLAKVETTRLEAEKEASRLKAEADAKRIAEEDASRIEAEQQLKEQALEDAARVVAEEDATRRMAEAKRIAKIATDWQKQWQYARDSGGNVAQVKAVSLADLVVTLVYPDGSESTKDTVNSCKVDAAGNKKEFERLALRNRALDWQSRSPYARDSTGRIARVEAVSTKTLVVTVAYPDGSKRFKDTIDDCKPGTITE
jgi:hypothetical protein